VVIKVAQRLTVYIFVVDTGDKFLREAGNYPCSILVYHTVLYHNSGEHNQYDGVVSLDSVGFYWSTYKFLPNAGTM
jgi:hypothetical protein